MWGGKGRNKLGFAAVYCNDNINNKAYISMIVVKKEYQYRGIGTKLLEEVIKIVRDAGMKIIILEVAKGNDKARNFYGKQGFLQVNETEGSYFMGKEINK